MTAHCPDSRVSRLTCKPASLAWARLDAPTRLVLDAVGGSLAPDARKRVLGHAPASCSDLRGKASQYRTRYVARLDDALGTLARMGVPVHRVTEGKRRVLRLGRAFGPCTHGGHRWANMGVPTLCQVLRPHHLVALLPAYRGQAYGPGSIPCEPPYTAFNARTPATCEVTL